MTTKELAQVLGTTPNVVTENGKKLFPNKKVQRGKAVDWTGEEVTVLIDHMRKNPSNNAGDELISSTYKSELSTNLTPALKIQQAMLLMQEGYEEEIARLESDKQLLLEQKQAAEAETERIYQVNKNFHNNLYTATDLAKMLGTSPNKVGKIANEHHLKQDPIYGKLGKVQLNNGRWVDIFYYNDDAKLVIENNL